MKRLVAVMLAAGLIFAACSSSSSTDETTSGTSATAGEPSPGPDAATVDVCRVTGEGLLHAAGDVKNSDPGSLYAVTVEFHAADGTVLGTATGTTAAPGSSATAELGYIAKGAAAPAQEVTCTVTGVTVE